MHLARKQGKHGISATDGSEDIIAIRAGRTKAIVHQLNTVILFAMRVFF